RCSVTCPPAPASRATRPTRSTSPSCAPSRTPRWRAPRPPARRRSLPPGSDHEAAIVEAAERVVVVEAGEHGLGALRPRERLGRRDAPEHLHDAAFVDAVLGPRAREV